MHTHTHTQTHTHTHAHTQTEAPAHASRTRCISELQRAFKGNGTYSYLGSCRGALNEISDCLLDCDQTPTEGPIQAANHQAA